MSPRRPADEDQLFDLPLDRTPAAAGEPFEQPPLPFADEVAVPAPEPIAAQSDDDGIPVVEMPPAKAPRASLQPPVATLRLRATAGLIDLGVCGAVAVVLLVALLAQGIQPQLSDWPGATLFLLSFGFLYVVLPLAFWGRTPGMALVGLRSSGRDGGPLTFRQAILKWLGYILTLALGGLPLLLALGGRSLSDLVSGSTTRITDRAG